MSDPFRQLLKDLEDPRKFVRRDDVPVFDEHDETDGQGNLTRRFDRAFLELIAQRSNARDATGSLCPLSIGHTVSGASEQSQPIDVGYARHFKVIYHQRLKKWVITATYYIRKEQFAAAQTFPRTSVELWPDDWILDPIALLRRTPRRDLGQWTYAMGSRGKQVLRYSMEANMPDDVTPTPAPPANPATPAEPSEHEMAHEYMRHCMSHKYARKLAAKYGMEGGDPASPLGNEPPAEPLQNSASAPTATNVSVPGTRQPDQHARTSPEVIRLQRENEQFRRDLAVERQARITGERRLDLLDLLDQGWMFDLEAELKDVVGLTPEQYGRHLERIKTNYAHNLTADMIPVQGQGPDGGSLGRPLSHGLPAGGTQSTHIGPDGGLSNEGVHAALAYQRDQGGPEKCSWEQARGYVIQAARKSA